MMRKILKQIISPFLQKASAIYLQKPRPYVYRDISVIVSPTVFPPFITFSTKLLLGFVEKLPLSGKSLLELGCGCGIISILAAKKNADVTASDINETALLTLKKNAADNNVVIKIVYSDMFENLQASYDFIIINPPYYPKQPKTIAEQAWFCGEDYQYFEKLFYELRPYKSETFMILSEDCNIAHITSIAERNALKLSVVESPVSAGEKNFIFRISAL